MDHGIDDAVRVGNTEDRSHVPHHRFKHEARLEQGTARISECTSFHQSAVVKQVRPHHADEAKVAGLGCSTTHRRHDAGVPLY